MPVDQVAPTINMSKLLRQLGHRTGQSRKVVFYREPIYGKDSYGVENTTVVVDEIVVPEVQAYIRTQISKDFVIQKGGGNIVGSALIYLPRLNTLKNFPNLDQDNNIYFNEIEGWDKIIDKDRVVYSVPTSGEAGWTASAGSLVSDGESVDTTFTGNGNVTYTTTAKNTLEADRLQFQIYGSGGVQLNNTRVYHGNTTSGTLDINNTNFALTDNTWLTVDVPFLSGTASGSIYQGGSRASVTFTPAASFDYEDDFRTFRIEYSADSGDTLKIRNIKYYKSTEWSVHSVRDYTDEYMCLECVRTAGKRDSRRRAYA